MIAEYRPDIYHASPDERFRYLLGQKGKKMLVAFGINPSKANQKRSDATVTRVVRTAAKNQFDGWLMMNVCPQRSTDPKGLKMQSLQEEHRKNSEAFREILKTIPDYACLGAWGNLIESRDYLKHYLTDLVSSPDLIKRKWFCFGTTHQGHPKHPSRSGYNQFRPFDMVQYMESFGWGHSRGQRAKKKGCGRW